MWVARGPDRRTFGNGTEDRPEDDSKDQQEAFRVRLQQHPGARGRRARPSPPRDVHRHHQLAGLASPRLRGRRQRHRRGHGRACQEDRRHHPRRRLRERLRRRRGHPRQGDPRRQGPPSGGGGRAHHAERRRQVRRRWVPHLRRPARGGRVRGQRALRTDDRRRPARGLHVAPGVRAGQGHEEAREGQGDHEDRHHHPVLAGPRGLHGDARLRTEAPRRTSA